MRAAWEQAGLKSVEAQVIRIPIVLCRLRRFLGIEQCAGRAVRQCDPDLSPSAREALKARLREQLPIAADGRIAYEAFANAVKGRAPG